MATCRVCGAPIEWRMTANGRWRPYDLDGTVHFATCTAAHLYDRGRWRRYLREHTYGEDADAEIR